MKYYQIFLHEEVLYLSPLLSLTAYLVISKKNIRTKTVTTFLLNHFNIWTKHATKFLLGHHLQKSAAGKMLSASYLQCHAACSRAVFPSKCMCAHSICIAFIPQIRAKGVEVPPHLSVEMIRTPTHWQKWINQYRVWRIVELSSGVVNCNTSQGPNGLWNVQ